MRVVMSRFGARSFGFPAVIEAFEHLDLADLRGVGLCRRVKVQLAVFHQLKARRPGNRLGGRENGEDAVGRHRRHPGQSCACRRRLRRCCPAVGGHRHHARHAGLPGDHPPQDRVGGAFQILSHFLLPVFGGSCLLPVFCLAQGRFDAPARTMDVVYRSAHVEHNAVRHLRSGRAVLLPQSNCYAAPDISVRRLNETPPMRRHKASGLKRLYGDWNRFQVQPFSSWPSSRLDRRISGPPIHAQVPR